MQYRSLALTTSLLLAIAATGCGVDANELFILCSGDADCPADGVCDLNTGQCMARATSALGLEVLPPSNNQGWVRQEFIDPLRGADGSLMLPLAEAVSLQGIVYSSDAPDVPIPASIIARRASLIEGRPSVQFQTQAPDRDRPESSSFVLWLNTGHKYSLFVAPRPPFDVSLPPALASNVQVDGHAELDVALDGPGRSVSVVGRVVDAAGKPLPFSVKVSAAAEGGWLRSTVGQTCSASNQELCDCTNDNECLGKFKLQVPFGVKPYIVQIEPLSDVSNQADGTGAFVPKVECEKAVLGLLEPGKTALELPVPIKLPSFPLAQEYKVKVVGSDDLPVAGAQVTFSTTLVAQAASPFQSCTARYERSQLTDTEGKATFMLLPGEEQNRIYALAVRPPADSMFASFQNPSYDIASGGTLAPIRLQERYQLRGTVTDFNAVPVPGARIEAQGLVSSSTGGSTPGDVSTTTDDQGLFVLYVDPGNYNFHISPPTESGVPSFSRLRKGVTGLIEGLSFDAPSPELLVGQVILPPKNDKLAPATGFTVQAFDVAPQTGTSVTSVLRTTAISDDHGHFRLVLPAVQ